jgi:glycosyltransferase involved in cell wall biosynthesis
VGRFDRHKGGDLIVDAFRLVLDEIPEARLAIVGPDRGCTIADRRWQLREYVADRLPGALERGQVACPGQLTQEELPGYRRTAAVTVVPSRWEGLARAALEALAYGCPTVAAAVGGIPEAVTDGATGVLVRPEDPAELARQIVRLMRDRDLASRLGAAAVLDCERRFGPRPIAEQTVQYYRKVIERRRGRR